MPRRLGCRSVVLALALALVGGGSSVAAGTWSEPVMLGEASPVIPVQLAFEDSGRALIGSSTATQVTVGQVAVEGHLVWRSATGAVGRDLVLGDEVRSIAQSGPHTMLVLGLHIPNAPPYREVSELLEVSAGGRTRRPLRISGGDAEMAARRSGAALVAWTTGRMRAGSPHGSIVHARWRTRAGRPFDRAQSLGIATATARGLAVAVGPRGEMVVVWNTGPAGHGGLRARLRAPGQGRFGREIALGGAGSLAQIAAAFDRTGRLYIVWGTHDTGEEVNKPHNVYATFVDPGARHAARRQALDLADRVFVIVRGGVWLAALPSGGAVAGWNGVHSGATPLPVRVSTAGRSGRFGAAITLDSSGLLSDLTVRPSDGTIAATWQPADPGYEEPPTTVLAALRAPDSPFDPTETIASGPTVGPATLAFNPRDGTLLAAWTQGTGPLGSSVHLQIAQRSD